MKKAVVEFESEKFLRQFIGVLNANDIQAGTVPRTSIKFSVIKVQESVHCGVAADVFAVNEHVFYNDDD